MDKKFKAAEAKFIRNQIHTQFSERGMHLKRVRVSHNNKTNIYQIQVARNKVRQAPYIASPEAQARARARA